MSRKKLLYFAAVLVMMALICAVGAVYALASEEKAAEKNTEIDVWLIAGQSNAVGFGSDGLSAQTMTDKRYTEGFTNVLFYGDYESTYNPTGFVPVTVGLGKQSASNDITVGAEIGIASAVGDGSRMNAVIKHAVGGTYLYPTTDGTVTAEHGTWTSPSYIEKYGVDTSTNKIGDLYTGFMSTVEEGLAMLVAEGYTPVIKGIWWMQGEAETPYESRANAYRELLTTLISDMRADLSEISGTDLSELPFVMGKITRNPDPQYTQHKYVDTVNAAQLAVVSSVRNTFIVDTSGLKQLDGWHFSAEAQKWIGEQFVNTIIAAEGKFNVVMSGNNASMIGGGIKAPGDTVTVVVTPYEGCTVTSVKIKVGSSDAYTVELDANGAYTFTMPADYVTFEVVSVDPEAEQTPYGLIPSRFTDKDKYPFLLFKDGELLQAYSKFHTVLNENRIKGATLLMRRDYSTTESGDHTWGICYLSDFVIDLGGYTLTRGDYHLFQVMGRGEEQHDSSVRIINGTLKTSYLKSDGKAAHPLFVFNNSTTSTVADNFDITLDGITLDVSEGRGIVAVYGDGTVGSKAKITLNNCTIYRGSSTATMTLFALKDSTGNKNDIDVVINGGVLVADTLAGLTLATYSPERESGNGSPDSLSVTENVNDPFSVDLPADYTVPSGGNDFTGGKYYLVNPVDADGRTVYTLYDASTKYGSIPYDYRSAEDYPFVLFKNGVMKVAFKDWKSFIDSTVYKTADYKTGCTLLLRRDYSTSEASGSPWALSYITDMVIDLGGNTLTRGNNHLFQANVHGSVKNTTTIKIINGTLKTQYYKDNTTDAFATPPIVFNSDKNATVSDSFEFVIEGVTLDVSLGRGIVAAYGDGTYGSNSRVVLNNCTVYRGSSVSTSPLFDLKDSKGNKNDVEVVLNGCKIIADSLNGLKLSTLNDERDSGCGSPDSIVMGSGTVEIELPSGYTLPKTVYAFKNGNYYPVDPVENTASGTLIYTLLNLTTEYGDITSDYASALDYPFVLFKNGVMKVAFKDWKSFIDSTVYKTADYKTGCTLLLRRDYSTSEASGSPWALSYITDMVIDLGGNTLTRGNNHLFQANVHGSVKNTTTIKIINGTLKTQYYKDNTTDAFATPPIVFNSDKNATVSDSFEFVIEGVTIDVSLGRGIVAAYGDGTYGSNSRVVLNNCTVYRGSSTGSLTLFDLKDSKGNKNDVEVVINGGRLVADSARNLTFASYDTERESGKGAPDSLIFGRWTDGKYLTATILNSSNAPFANTLFDTDDGVSCSFAKISEDAKYANYSLYPEVMKGYKIKTSVTLWSNFVYNIYIPQAGVSAFLVNGNNVAYEEVMMGETAYYHIAINLAASESLSDIDLKVILKSKDTEVTARWNLSTLSYIKKVLADSPDPVTEALMLDMLSYASAAHIYFKNTAPVAGKLDEIASILKDYNSAVSVGEAKKISGDSYFTKTVIYLGDVPSFRFYLADSYRASDFSFTVGSVPVNVTEDGNGKYIEIVMYAYMMLDDVSFTVTDKISGETVNESWNLYAYYEYSQTLGEDHLVDIVAALMRYSESAKAYKNASLNG